MRPRRVALAVLLACLACAPAVEAKTSFAPEPGFTVTNYRVAGGRAYWTEENRAAGGLTVWAGTPDGRRRALLRLPVGTTNAAHGPPPLLSASATHVYVVWGGTDARDHGVVLGATGGLKEVPDACSRLFDAQLLDALLVYDNDGVGGNGGACGDGTLGTMNPVTGASAATLTVKGPIAGAGRLVAWRVPDHGVAVLDAPTQRLVRFVPTPAARRSWHAPAVDRDGNVAILNQDREYWPYASQVFLSQPGQPLRRIAIDAMNSVVLAGGKVGFRQRTGRTPEPIRDQFIVTDLDGKLIQGFWAAARGPLGFDGRVVAALGGRGLLVSEFPVPGEKALPDRSPAVTRFSISRRRFGVVGFDRPRRGLGVGARIRYRLEAKGDARIRIDRLRGGRARKVGTITLGRRRVKGSYLFTGYVAGKRLPRGRYRATIAATAHGYRAGKGRRLTFRIVKPH